MTLAPSLGRLTSPPRRGGDDDLRLELVDRLVVGAGASGGGWVDAWREVSTALATRLLDEATNNLRGAAAHSRYPAASLQQKLPGEREREQLIERLVAEGVDLERLELLPVGAATDRARGAAAEAAWDRATAVARGERIRWAGVVSGVRHWRRPWRPLIIAVTIALPLVALAAAWLGGWLPAPAWFDPIGRAFWSLPWP